MANCQATKPTGKTAKPTGKKRWRLAPGDAHEWVSFKDPTGQRTWRFDVTFLLSNWRCIYGRGCQGTLTTQAPELAEGCCSYGAHFTSEADRQRVETAARALTPDQWQFATEGRRRGVARRRPGNAGMTRIVKRACIFLNRPGFPGGPGCALHRAALETGLLPMALKPDVCWGSNLNSHPVGPGALGRRRGAVRLVVHRSTRSLRGPPARVAQPQG
jgi:hypothetical protein